MAATNNPVHQDDLSALAWVEDELRRSLELANKALRRYLKEQAQLSELDTVDPAVLRQARSQLHQSVGVLELVGLGRAAEVLRAAEAALARLSARPKLITAAAVDTLERSSFALLDFIARRLAGKPVSTLALFPQYRALQELAGATRVHPADLWTFDWSWRDLALDASVSPRRSDAETVSRIEADLLAMMRGAAPSVAARMSELFAGLAASAHATAASGGASAEGVAVQRRLTTLWQLAAGFFEAQADDLLQLDSYSKRVGSKLLAQLRAGEQAEPSERLAQDLLFFCSQAAPRVPLSAGLAGDATGAAVKPATKPFGPRLLSVRRSYDLGREVPVDFEHARLGRYQPAWVTQARKRVAAAKEGWSAVAGGDLARLPGLPDQFSLVSESLAKLYLDGAVLGRALQVAAAHTVAGAAEPVADLAMEVATALLYIDASLDDGDFDHVDSAARIQRLAQRIDLVRQARDPGTLELWMEELYRRVSDRQTMGSVVHELRSSLSEVEKNIDQYFRNPSQREVLIPVPAQLSAMRGVLSVLGLDQASQAVLRMRDDVDALANTEIDAQHALEAGTFERLADNLGALSFLIDMVSVQPQMAKSLFKFDPATGSLSAVMPREDRPSGFDEMATQPAELSGAALDTDALAVTLEFDRIVEKSRLAQRGLQSTSALAQERPQADNRRRPPPEGDESSGQATLTHVRPQADNRRRPPPEGDESSGQATLTHELGVQALEGLHGLPMLHLGAAPVSEHTPRTAASGLMPLMAAAPITVTSSGLEDDPEMREVFLDEALEVLQCAREALHALQLKHDDASALTTVRRSFHTLKGSARMVGLLPFGDAAWACEQLYNARLAEPGGTDHDLREFSLDACAYLERWVRGLEASNASAFHADVLIHAADTLRTERRRVPLLADAAQADAVVADAVVADDEWVAVVAAEPAQAPSKLPELRDPEFAPAVVGVVFGFTPSLPATELPALPELMLATPDLATLPVAIELPALPEVSELALLDDTLAHSAPLPLLVPLAPATPQLSSPPSTQTLRLRVPNLPLASDLDLVGLVPAAAEVAVASEPLIAVAEATEIDLPLEFSAGAEPAELALDLSLDGPSVEPLDLELDALEPVALAVPQLPVRTQVLDGPPVSFVAPESPSVLVTTPVTTPVPTPVTTSIAPAKELEPLHPPAPAAAETEVQAEVDAESYRQVGSLRIGIPLFNIYLNEADELSRRLGVGLAEWALEQPRAVGEASVSLAHSLAGSSGTVGYAELSQLARELEHALGRSQARGHGLGDETVLFTEVATEIRRLLHLFAAGFLNSPDADLVRRLHEVAYAVPDAPPGERPQADDIRRPPPEGVEQSGQATFAQVRPQADDRRRPPTGLQARRPSPATRPLPGPYARAQPPEGVEQSGQATLTHEAVAAETAPGPHAASVMSTLPEVPHEPFASVLGRTSLMPFTALSDVPSRPLRGGSGVSINGFDEEIDQQDVLDEELFPYFVEEASEWIPQLHSHLRDWAKKPSDPAAASACMRCLHSLKGSARLAGAMRLGEMAHRLESAVEQLATGPGVASPAGVDTLMSFADTLETAFDALRTTAAAVPAAAPVAASPAKPATSLNKLVVDKPLPTEAGAGNLRAHVVPAPRALVLPSGSEPTLPALDIDWTRFAATAAPSIAPVAAHATATAGSVRVRAPLLDRVVNHAGEVSITRARIQSDVGQLKTGLADLTDNLERLRSQLRDIELQAETQIGTRMEAARAAAEQFDPLEMDRFTRFQELTRMMAESVADVATVQRGLQRTLQSAEDALAHQARMTRDMQDDLLRTRMVEFEGLSDRLYRVVRQAAKETAKPVRLDIVGGGVEIDRSVLDRMTPAFEHLLRNSVVHGIEPAAQRAKAGKDATGTITMAVTQIGNEVSVEVRDDGAGLNLPRIRERALAMGLIEADARPDDAALANLIFQPGVSTAAKVTDLAGRGVGMDVVRTDVNAMGGRIETASALGQGTSFRLVLPLTTAVTQVVTLRCGERTVAVPSTLIELVRRVPLAELALAYEQGSYGPGAQALPFFWLDALLGGTARGGASGRTAAVVVIRSAAQRVALHVDEVLGNQEVVVKNLGPQLSRVPGLVGMTLLPSGLPALIYNPVALAALYGEGASAATAAAVRLAGPGGLVGVSDQTKAKAPLVLVVDDSLTVRRVTQRLLEREGYRVTVAKDGLDGLEKLAAEVPDVLLTDIEMPRMDGFDLVRNLRVDSRLAKLPVIMITSRIAKKHRDYAVELGVDHYLGKPYAEDELLSLVARYARPRVI